MFFAEEFILVYFGFWKVLVLDEFGCFASCRRSVCSYMGIGWTIRITRTKTNPIYLKRWQFFEQNPCFHFNRSLYEWLI